MSEAPEIVITIPGPWGNRTALAAALTRLADGFVLIEDTFSNSVTKESFFAKLSTHDGEVVDTFLAAPDDRLGADAKESIRGHVGSILMIGPGGGVEQARGAMMAAKAFLDAGGFALRVETSASVHSPASWKALSENEHASALYTAYVTVLREGTMLYSCGMHNLGLMDACVSVEEGALHAAEVLSSFLKFCIVQEPRLRGGHTFSIRKGAPVYELREEKKGLFEEGNAMWNRWGYWVLEKKI